MAVDEEKPSSATEEMAEIPSPLPGTPLFSPEAGELTVGTALSEAGHEHAAVAAEETAATAGPVADLDPETGSAAP